MKLRAQVFLAVFVCACVVTMAGTAPAFGQDNGAQPAGQFKIGVINMKIIFDQYNRQKAEYDALKKQRDDKQKSIDALSEQIKTKKADYDSKKAGMTDDQRDAAEADINKLLREYEAEFKKLQGDIDSLEKQLLERVFKDIHEAINAIGNSENYHLILESGESNRSGVLFSSPTLDMTQKVVNHLNSKATSKPAA